MRLRLGDKHHLRKSSDRNAQISPVSGTNPFLICAFRSAGFLRWCLSHRAQPHAQSLLVFPIVFGINLIHLFDEKKVGAARNSIVCFGASIPCHAIWQQTKIANCFEDKVAYLHTVHEHTTTTTSRFKTPPSLALNVNIFTNKFQNYNKESVKEDIFQTWSKTHQQPCKSVKSKFWQNFKPFSARHWLVASSKWRLVAEIDLYSCSHLFWKLHSLQCRRRPALRVCDSCQPSSGRVHWKTRKSPGGPPSRSRSNSAARGEAGSLGQSNTSSFAREQHARLRKKKCKWVLWEVFESLCGPKHQLQQEKN